MSATPEKWVNFTESKMLQMAIFGEAEGEGFEGQLAVGLTIRNRVVSKNEKWFGAGWKGVILKPYQFSSFNEGSPRIPAMLKFMQHRNPETLYNQIWWIGKGIFYGWLTEDVTHGANHFLTVKLFESDDRPKWADPNKVTTVIKNHVFLRL